jgi:hypothetical protein
MQRKKKDKEATPVSSARNRFSIGHLEVAIIELVILARSD